MLNRRQSLQQLASSGCLLAPGFFQLDHAAASTQLVSLSSVQRNLSLDVTVGSVIGAALGSLIYLAFARAAPADLVATFARAVIQGASSTNLNQAAGSYIENAASKVNYDTEVSRSVIKQDTQADTLAFTSLTSAVRVQTERLISVQNNLSASVRELREQLAEVRKEIEIVRLERSRAFSSTAIYGSVEQQTRRTGIDSSGQLEDAIGQAQQEARNLNRHCEALEDQVLRM